MYHTKCPTEPGHKQFITLATVESNAWTCAECGDLNSWLPDYSPEVCK